MKLLKMTDFVLSQDKGGMEVQAISHQQSERARRYYKILERAKFLKRPLELGMFIPCDEDGYPLAECKYLYDVWKNLGDKKKEYEDRCENYLKAKEGVLFEGFETQFSAGIYRFYNKESDLRKMWSIGYSVKVGFQDKYKTIEDLCGLDIELKKL